MFHPIRALRRYLNVKTWDQTHVPYIEEEIEEEIDPDFPLGWVAQEGSWHDPNPLPATRSKPKIKTIRSYIFST